MESSPAPYQPKDGFHLDAFRASFAMAAVAYERLGKTLDTLEALSGDAKQHNPSLASALLDVWSLIDIYHRVRELTQQSPLFSWRTPFAQIFLRKIECVENLRHHVQHFRSGIHKLPEETHPLWGALSWISSKNDQRNYTFISGTMRQGVEAYTCAYDTYEGRFCRRVQFSAAGIDIDLHEIHKSFLTFQSAFIAELKDSYTDVGLGMILCLEIPETTRQHWIKTAPQSGLNTEDSSETSEPTP